MSKPLMMTSQRANLRFNQGPLPTLLCELEMLEPQLIGALDDVVNYATPALRMRYLKRVINQVEQDIKSTDEQDNL